jgi:hypothetical protein
VVELSGASRARAEAALRAEGWRVERALAALERPARRSGR